MAMKLPDDFREFLKSLNEHKVRYLLIGGWAVGLYGYPRATGDIDVWISNDKDNVERVVKVLHEFGFSMPEVKSELFESPKGIIRMGMSPLRIELHITIDGVEFEECYSLREVKQVNGFKINVIDLQNLIKNKKTAGRHKDLDDIENLTS